MEGEGSENSNARQERTPPPPVEGNQRAELLKKAGEIAYQEVPGILDTIDRQVRRIIHGEHDA
jgi:hypothetical protein